MASSSCSAMLRAPTTAPRTSARPAASRPSKLLGPLPNRQQQQQRKMAPTSAVNELFMLAEIDWTDPDTQIGVLGGVLGLALGIGAPVFYSMRDDADEKRLEELRSLNRETFKETGEYLSSEEIADIRPPRWTDRREFVDDD